MNNEALLKYIRKELRTARDRFYGHQAIDDASYDTGYWSGYMAALSKLRRKIVAQNNESK